MSIPEYTERAMQIRELFAQYEQQLYGRIWSPEEIALGFVGDVGDLMKLIQAKEGVRQISDKDAKLAHELADCLWSILVLARLYDVDLEEAFFNTMDNIEETLINRLDSDIEG